MEFVGYKVAGEFCKIELDCRQKSIVKAFCRFPRISGPTKFKHYVGLEKLHEKREKSWLTSRWKSLMQLQDKETVEKVLYGKSKLRSVLAFLVRQDFK